MNVSASALLGEALLSSEVSPDARAGIPAGTSDEGLPTSFLSLIRCLVSGNGDGHGETSEGGEGAVLTVLSGEPRCAEDGEGSDLPFPDAAALVSITDGTEDGTTVQKPSALEEAPPGTGVPSIPTSGGPSQSPTDALAQEIEARSSGFRNLQGQPPQVREGEIPGASETDVGRQRTWGVQQPTRVPSGDTGTAEGGAGERDNARVQSEPLPLRASPDGHAVRPESREAVKAPPSSVSSEAGSVEPGEGGNQSAVEWTKESVQDGVHEKSGEARTAHGSGLEAKVLRFREQSLGRQTVAEADRGAPDGAGVQRSENVGFSQMLDGSVREVEGARAQAPVSLPGSTQEGILEQLADHARLLLRVGRNKAEIQLEPPELGKLRLHLTVSDSVVRGLVEVENPAVRAVIQSDLSRLAAALAEKGLNLGQFDVLLLDDRQAGGQGTFEGASDRGTPVLEAPLGETPGEDTAASVPRSVSGGSLVDYWF